MTFFQTLRDIQKKERATGTLSEIEDTFYDDASKYIQELFSEVGDNPLSLDAYQLRDAQRITIEICERREFKIISTAIANVQKAHDIFKGHKKDSDLYDTIPYNVTPEEEALYKEIIELIIRHREELMEEIIPSKTKKTETKIGFKPKKSTTKEPLEEKIEKTTPKEASTQSNNPIIDAPSPKKLNIDEVALMFGQAPDDVIIDEDNNPVKEKTPKRNDILAPFEPPEVPKEDSVSLQEPSKYIKKDEEEKIEQEDTIVEESSDEITPESEEEIVGEVVEQYDDHELVEFMEEITTDVLDEEEKTYGPFDVNDVAILPKSLVSILVNKDVVKVIK